MPDFDTLENVCLIVPLSESIFFFFNYDTIPILIFVKFKAGYPKKNISQCRFLEPIRSDPSHIRYIPATFLRYGMKERRSHISPRRYKRKFFSLRITRLRQPRLIEYIMNRALALAPEENHRASHILPLVCERGRRDNNS